MRRHVPNRRALRSLSRTFFAAAGLITLLIAPSLAESSPAQRGAAWDAKAAMQDISRQLTFGDRAFGTPGHEKTLRMVRAQFASLGIPTTLQTWTEQTPLGPRQLTNIIAHFNPSNPRRVLLGTHYDSITRAYADPTSPNAIMPGANNSASGVAMLLETARALKRSPPSVGVDFVFFDGEEGPISLGAGDPNWHALGSPHYVRALGPGAPGRPAQTIIFDMVCYRNIKLQPELSSISTTPDAVNAFWSLGRARFPSVFVSEPTGYAIGDDQSAFQAINVPSLLVIGFEYAPYFNTTADTIDKCSPDTLTAIGETVVSYLRSL